MAYARPVRADCAITENHWPTVSTVENLCARTAIDRSSSNVDALESRAHDSRSQESEPVAGSTQSLCPWNLRWLPAGRRPPDDRPRGFEGRPPPGREIRFFGRRRAGEPGSRWRLPFEPRLRTHTESLSGPRCGSPMPTGLPDLFALLCCLHRPSELRVRIVGVDG
jgi:hypothetical protein